MDFFQCWLYYIYIYIYICVCVCVCVCLYNVYYIRFSLDFHSKVLVCEGAITVGITRIQYVIFFKLLIIKKKKKKKKKIH
jgi:hypothetical protein